MSHVGAHFDAALAFRLRAPAVVDGLIEAVAGGHIHVSQVAQVVHPLLWRNRQSQHRGVRRDDQILLQPAFETQPGDAKRPVLIRPVGIEVAEA